MPNLSYSKKLIIKNIIWIVVIICALVALLYFSFNSATKDFVNNKRWADPTFLALIVGFVIGFTIGMLEMKFLDKFGVFLDKILYELKNALKGNKGEKKAFNRLNEMLGSSYRLYRNFKIPGKKFDIDAMIVGPKGIIIIEVKNLNGHFRFSGSDVYKINRYPNGNICSCQLNYASNPINEVIRHKQALEEWFMKNNFEKINTRGALLMVGDSFKIEELEKPAVFVIVNTDGIKKYIDDLFEEPAFTGEYCRKINELLALKPKI